MPTLAPCGRLVDDCVSEEVDEGAGEDVELEDDVDAKVGVEVAEVLLLLVVVVLVSVVRQRLAG